MPFHVQIFHLRLLSHSFPQPWSGEAVIASLGGEGKAGRKLGWIAIFNLELAGVG